MSGDDDESPSLNGSNSNFILKAVCVVVSAFFCACLFVIRYIFGTYSVTEALTIYRKVKSLEEKYLNLFNQRDNTEYHIGCARSRGDNLEVRQLMKTLDVIDDDLDALESEIKMWKESKGAPSKIHNL